MFRCHGVLTEGLLDNLVQTPAFYQDTALKRLDGAFSSAYRYAEA